MTEDYLHQIWKEKRLPFHEIIPINASTIEVKKVGEYNENQKGPDFQLGSVNIDGVDFYGNIEIHVKSSDWYKHNHHFDQAYNNVILHVVHEYDKPVYQDGFLIPTIELKGHIDGEHYNKYKLGTLIKNDFPCHNLLTEIDPIYLESMKVRAYSERMMIKTKLLQDANLDDKSIFYQLIATAFGTSINKQGFNELVHKIPHHQLKQIESPKQKFQLLMAEGGLIQRNRESKSTSVWHFKGTRPSNFPDIRLKQFAQFVSRYDFDTSFIYLSALEIKAEFFKMTDYFWSNEDNHVRKINKSFSNLLIINAVVPFMWYNSESIGDERLVDKAIEILESLPSEKNKHMGKWKKCLIDPKNAFDSQSLLSLYLYHCSRKKCLTCDVGYKLLTGLNLTTK
ncbi:MAG: DUF2851 family protein [Crocinitomicaceae bacterium]